MKKCPLCAEVIQDQAIRCKHCNGNLAAHSATERSEKKTSSTRGISTIALIVLGAFAGYTIASKNGASSFKMFEEVIVGAALFPIGWAVGWAFGKVCQPNVVFGKDAIQIGLRRIGYYLMPLCFAIAGSLASLFGVVQIFHGVSTKTETAPTSSALVNEPPVAAKHTKHRKKLVAVDGANTATAQKEDTKEAAPELQAPTPPVSQ